MRLRLARVATIAAVVVALCGYLDHFTATFHDLEQGSYRVCMEIAAQSRTDLRKDAREDVAVVTASDATFDSANPDHLPGPPLPRAYYAKLVQELTRDGATVIAFDIRFDTPRPGDAAFAEAMRKSGRVLLACDEDETRRPSVVLPEPMLRDAAAGLGHTGEAVYPEQFVIDRIPSALGGRGKPIPAFSVQAARTAGGTAPETRPDADGMGEGFKIRYFDANGLTDSDGTTFVNVPLEQAIGAGSPWRDWFRGKVVVVGKTSRADSDKDQHQTPVGEMWGVDIQAHAIATLLVNNGSAILHDAPPWAEVGTLIALAVLASLLAGMWGLKRTALLLVLLLPAYYGFNLWLFLGHNLDLHRVAPTATVLLTALGVLLERGMTEEQEKTRLRVLLHRYVSPQIAAYILQHPELLGRAGKRVTGTVLFSDIRGFTALSEQIPPEELVSRMNEYFQTMTEIVFRHEGTAASIVGDAMLALFGVPVPYPDHAKRAVAAAIEMQDALRTLQARWRSQDQHAFDIGIGINTGEMVVGDVGGRHLMNFTVYGLQVNIASRVEGLNKELGTCILITDATYQSVADDIQARGPGAGLRQGRGGRRGGLRSRRLAGRYARCLYPTRGNLLYEHTPHLSRRARRVGGRRPALLRPGAGTQ